MQQLPPLALPQELTPPGLKVRWGGLFDGMRNRGSVCKVKKSGEASPQRCLLAHCVHTETATSCLLSRADHHLTSR